MGGDYYDREVITTSSDTGYSEVSTKAVGTVNRLHSSLDPKRWKDDNLQCNVKNPIIFALDVTGSMGDWTRIVYDKMPMFYGQIMIQNYLQEPAISFCAVGDYTCDEAPLQVTEFGEGREIDQLISKMYLEGGGGGSFYESYDLAAYFYSNHVDLIDPELPFFFITGDESFYEKIPEKYITRVIGKPINDIYLSSRDCWKDLMKKYNVFLIKKPYPEENKEAKIKQQWCETIGEERVLIIENPKACVDVMLGAIALTSGNRTIEDYVKDMKNRGQTNERTTEVTNALSKYYEKVKSYREMVTTNKENMVTGKDLNKHVTQSNTNNSIGVPKSNILIQSNSNVAIDEALISEKNKIKENIDKLLEEDLDNDQLKLREDLKAMKQVFGEVPDQLICPITGDIFFDPVMTSDGHTYERKAIESWFEKHRTSPVTNLILDNKNLIPNFVIKQLVKAFYEENKDKI